MAFPLRSFPALKIWESGIGLFSEEAFALGLVSSFLRHQAGLPGASRGHILVGQRHLTLVPLPPHPQASEVWLALPAGCWAWHRTSAWSLLRGHPTGSLWGEAGGWEAQSRDSSNLH